MSPIILFITKRTTRTYKSSMDAESNVLSLSELGISVLRLFFSDTFPETIVPLVLNSLTTLAFDLSLAKIFDPFVLRSSL